MQSSTKRSVALAIVPSIIAFLLVQACGSSDDAIAQSAPVAAPPDPIVGVWDSSVTLRDCATGAAFGTFRGMNMLHLGGTVSDTGAVPPSTRGPGFGAWERRGAGPEYTVRFQFFFYKADGSFDGVRRIVRTFTLAPDGNTTNGSAVFQVFNPAGTEIASGCTTEVSTRAS